jgi:glycosyltransferase involved in cell wall biosynthesis
VQTGAVQHGTQALCEDLCLRDGRVHYIRQSTNKGPIAKFNEVFRHSHGELFMYSDDDDWLDPSYLSQCVSTLLEQPEIALVSGVWNWCRDQSLIQGNIRMNLLQKSGRHRVLSCYKQVRGNEVFHEVGSRDLLMKA